MALFGIVAPTGNGKTFAAKYLAKTYDMTTFHAGEPVKKAVRKAYGLSKAEVTDGELKDQPNPKLGGATPRQALDAQGSAMHKIAPMATAHALAKRVNAALARGEHVVVEGVRQPAEADYIKKRGGRLIGLDAGKPADLDKAMEQSAAEIVTDHLVNAKPTTKKTAKAAMESGLDEVMTKWGVSCGSDWRSGWEPAGNGSAMNIQSNVG